LYFPKIHSNIILPSTSGPCICSLPFRFSIQYFLCVSHLCEACYMPYQSYSPILNHPSSSVYSTRIYPFIYW
jgi:hypothetical protein